MKNHNGKGIPMQISMSLPWNSHLSPKIFSNQSNVKSSNKSKATHGKPWQKKNVKAVLIESTSAINFKIDQFEMKI